MIIDLQPEKLHQYGDTTNEDLTEVVVQIQGDEKSLKRRATIHTWKKCIAGIALGTLATSAFTFHLVPVEPASAGTCGQTKYSTVDGGEAAWLLSCNGSNITIDGWVKDTDADGKCAYLKATGNGRWMPQAKACPKGKKTFFRWTVPGGDIKGYLFVI